MDLDWVMLAHNAVLITVLVTSIIAIVLKDLLYSVIILAGASIGLAIAFYMLQAPDIALTEAVVNAGIATVLYVIAIDRTKREEEE